MHTRTIIASIFFVSSAFAQDWYASPEGKSSGAGIEAAPWDIASALNGSKKITPGDTLWLKSGTYKLPDRKPANAGFEVKLAGTKEKPIVIRAELNQRVNIDGGLRVVAPANAIWIRDIEIALSEPTKEVAKPNIPMEEMGRPWGGLEILSGKDCKYINLVIHNNAQGMGFWSGASDSEVYGCIIYDNGWKGPDRGHGHCIYTQNKDGVKTISNCIMQARFDGAYTMHAYGSARADVDHYLLSENIAYGRGPFLVGSGKPSHDIKVFNNVLYAVNMQLGYNAPSNVDCEVRGNYFFRGGLQINKFEKAVNEQNTIVKKDQPGREAKSFLFSNKYDLQRAHIAIYNPTKAAQVSVKLTGFTKAGDKLALYDPKNFFGEPLWKGTANSEEITLPAPEEFNVFVLKKQ